MFSILVVEDSPQWRQMTRDLIEREFPGYEVTTADSRDAALAALTRARPQLVLLDLLLPATTGEAVCELSCGEEVLAAAKGAGCFVIVQSTEAGLTRDFLIEKGADDFLAKGAAGDWQGETLPGQIAWMLGHLVCRSGPMRALVDGITTLPRHRGTALVHGVAGSGKEFLAGLLHRRATPKGGPLRPCHVLSGELPHELRAPSGGLVVLGLEHGGRLDPAAQIALAERVGRADSHPTYLTSVSAPAALASEPGLVPELAAALASVPSLHVPAPRERLDDIPGLLQAFRRDANRRFEARVSGVHPAVVELIADYINQVAAPTGWDAVKAAVDEGVRARGEGILGPGDVVLSGLPETCELVWCRGGTCHRERGTKGDELALAHQEWALILRAAPDDAAHAVEEVQVGADRRPVPEPRLGRLLYLLASRPGEQVEVPRHKRALGIALSTPTKRLIKELRELLGDNAVGGRRSRFLASHYSEAYSFLTDADYLLVSRLRVDP